MNGRGAHWVALLVALFALSLAFGPACSSEDAGAAPAGPHGPGGPRGRDAERPPTSVRVAVAETRALERTVEFVGELQAENTVRLAPDESGRLERLLVDEGDEVQDGQLIGRLENDVQRRRLAAAEASLASARARRDQAASQRDLQANEVDRRRPLAQRDAFPEAELARLEDTLAVAEQAVVVADAQVDEARAAVSAARADVDRREIRAPFAGLVAERHVSVGAVVSPQAPVVTVVDESSLHFHIRLSERRLGLVAPGTLASVHLDAFPDRDFSAEVRRVGRVVDPESRTIQVELTLSADGALLRSGMFGRGELVAHRLESAVVIAPEAVQTTREGTTRVWTVRDNQAQPVDVAVTLATEDAVAVEGLAPESRVILSPPMSLTPGGPVHVVGSGAAAGGRPPADGSGEGTGRLPPRRP